MQIVAHFLASRQHKGAAEIHDGEEKKHKVAILSRESVTGLRSFCPESSFCHTVKENRANLKSI